MLMAVSAKCYLVVQVEHETVPARRRSADRTLDEGGLGGEGEDT